MAQLRSAACLAGLVLAPLSARCLALNLTRAQAPEKMRASVCTRNNPEPCPIWVGDLGVHAAMDTVGKSCNPHLERIKVVERDMPAVRPGTALVKVAFSSVNPCNWKMILANMGPMDLGGEMSGQVVSVGSNCPGFKAGDEVWGMGGGYSEYAVHDCERLGLKPSSLSLKQAGVLPLVALTGLQGLEWAGAPWSSKPTVLVLGGSGGTGSTGIQMAKALGAGKVITTASKDNFDKVRGFGADEVIDYKTQNWWDVLGAKSVDVIYDCACITSTGDHAFDVLKDGGKFFTIQTGSRASSLKALFRPQVSQYSYVLDGKHMKTRHLNTLKEMAERGQLAAPIESTYGLDSVGQAFEKAMQGHTVGKIAIRVGGRPAH